MDDASTSAGSCCRFDRRTILERERGPAFARSTGWKEPLHARKQRWRSARALSTASSTQRSARRGPENSGSADSTACIKTVHTRTARREPARRPERPGARRRRPPGSRAHRGAESRSPVAVSNPAARGRPYPVSTVKRPSGGGGSPSKMKLREMNDWKISNDTLKLGVELGRGSFGIVMAAEWRHTPVALKILFADAQADDKVLFEKEVRMMATLHHPNIVQFLGYARTPALTLSD